ncbi:MAG: hypothetical protein AMXMBFR13_06080 [Phycisphaerae bacterium]
METIQAMVNPRLLTKANRLFTGTLQGRIIEILQNARRAGARQVSIINRDGKVHVNDNGRGIDDFNKLLDLGSSGWEPATESSEDPAGVGVFCLAPREVVIRSKGRQVTISDQGWTGQPVNVTKAGMTRRGTSLEFEDEPWDRSAVELNAVFCGMQVVVDGEECVRLPFVSDQAAHHPELGCRIEVRESQDLNPWHHSCKRERWYGSNVLVNFHGQVVAFNHHPANEHGLHYLVDMTDEPTGIRLMLPARTQLIENEAYKVLLAALELESFRFLQRRGYHRLSYKQFLRAKDLGITLPEAKPTYHVGLLTGDDPEPIEVSMPKDFPLVRCYRFDPDQSGEETEEGNAHLLAALGQFSDPFVAVSIHRDYDGYHWARLPLIGKVEVTVGTVLHQDVIWCGRVVCVDSLTISTQTSDGRKWVSRVCMALRPALEDRKNIWWDHEVLVTPEARDRLNPTDILYHLGGFSDEGDTWDTQEAQFSEEMERFWDQLVGPDEGLRRRILEPFESFTGWREATILPNGTVTIHFTNGSKKVIEPLTPESNT